MVIRIATPATQGYINFGDTIIFLASALFGPGVGAIAGGIGSGLADFLGGYAHWVPFTLIIKGLEGLVAALIVGKSRSNARTLAAFVIAAIWMVAGYYVASGFLYGFGPALVDVPGNLLQGGVSVIAGWLLVMALRPRFKW
jgi:uncharacterized membrane protein